MNELRIFNRNEFEKIKDFQKEKPDAVMGIVYAVEYDKGCCKIGMSSMPADRTFAIKHYISDYMQFPVNRIMISKWHTNYKENEKILHEQFSDCRIPNTELFVVGVEEVASFIENGGILMEDKSQEILDEIERCGKAIIDLGKSLLSGEFDRKTKPKSQAVIDYENMLMSEGALTRTVVEKTNEIINNYEEFYELKKKYEISSLKNAFIGMWLRFGIITEDDLKEVQGSVEE